MSAVRPDLTLEEIEQFKTLGFIVKRGLIPKQTLTPWVDHFWQTAHERNDLFAGALKRDDPDTWQDVADRWSFFHARTMIFYRFPVEK